MQNNELSQELFQKTNTLKVEKKDSWENIKEIKRTPILLQCCINNF